ncbi:MAG: vanadium-dependent haloperoxidase [Acidimicrobiia bacterium]
MSGKSSRAAAALLGVVVVVALVLGMRSFLDRGEDSECIALQTTEDWSVARRWNEALLNAIRRDLPAPTVHSRNLFHTSAAMWDAWAAYDDDAASFYVTETQSHDDVAAAREEAISYAAFRILEARYIDSIGAVETIPELDAIMESLCYPAEFTDTEGDTPAALGNRIALTILEMTVDDGSNEREGYEDPTYEPVNPPLVVAGSGAQLRDVNRWQPLQLENMVSQNGIEVENGVQEFIDPHWGHVTAFALPEGGPDGLPLDPGPPPFRGDSATDSEFRDAAVEVVYYSSILDPTDGVMVDISPASVGGSSLGTNDGSGWDLNPLTEAPYEENLVNQADFGRVLAEFWADGPDSETPPGHWNTVANSVSDTLDPDLRIAGEGSPVNRLEWDVKLYLVLNGANHDAAVAAWGSKRHYDYVRPISMIRNMGGLGQSSDPDQPSYDQDGLPLVPGLVEVVTSETTRPGERHEALSGHESEIAVRAWTGNPENPELETGGVAWILAVNWVTYQKSTFVTPAFAGYVSGHSTFSRASAEVLTAFTGSEFFPGGLGEWTIEAEGLEFEAGPSTDITLQWATYGDAADQAGLSRLYGGIHVAADDLAGRLMGAKIGVDAWNLARRLYGGDVDE